MVAAELATAVEVTDCCCWPRAADGAFGGWMVAVAEVEVELLLAWARALPAYSSRGIIGETSSSSIVIIPLSLGLLMAVPGTKLFTWRSLESCAPRFPLPLTEGTPTICRRSPFPRPLPRPRP